MASRSANVRGPITVYCAATSAVFGPGSGWALPGLLVISNSPAASAAPRMIARRGLRRVDINDLLGVGRSHVY
jgi:hypothetical protein